MASNERDEIIFFLPIVEACEKLSDFVKTCNENKEFLIQSSHVQKAFLIRGEIFLSDGKVLPSSVFCLAKASGFDSDGHVNEWIFHGRGEDSVGYYAVFGRFLSGCFQFIKKYDNRSHIVLYDADKSSIWCTSLRPTAMSAKDAGKYPIVSMALLDMI